MAGKRSASNDLNHDNWDKDDDPEDSGVFKRASDDTIKKRVIKTAKRRNPISSVREGESKTVFSGFSFHSTGTDKPASSSFTFLNNLQNKDDTSTKTNGTSFGQEKSSASAESNNKSVDYYARLKGLNESVAKWIKAKVDENPIVSLLPIFKDYEKYLDEIEKQKVNNDLAKIDTMSVASFTFKPASSMPAPDSTSEKSSLETKKAENNVAESKAQPQFSFGIPNKATESKTSTTTPSFSFGSSGSQSKPLFSFGTPTTVGSSDNSAPTFSFGSSGSTSFGSSTFAPAKPKPTEGEGDEEDDEDSPPKVEVTPVVEKDHIFTTRCKVFIKKDGNFGNGSVGNLFLKPIEGSEKVQLIVRADTNLGNLLCNFILAESIPTKRLGTKDVMLVCVPTPDAKPPPVPVLLRVKSTEEADELLKTLDEHKK